VAEILIHSDTPEHLEMCGYASVHDYEVRTGLSVPDDQFDTYCQWLTDATSIIRLYLGPCAESVEAAYPDVLAMMACQRVQRTASIPPGVSSTSVGGTSVSFVDSGASAMTLTAAEQDLLDRLISSACGELGADEVPGLGQLGVKWGGGDGDSSELWVVASPQPRIRGLR
jgi:hypothetical protein